ncbi:MAG: hypothetical protein RDU25_03350 [Patescibacteria group bacterium]|nr:hypothetical protein [Patescibacteria group bacterium]
MEERAKLNAMEAKLALAKKMLSRMREELSNLERLLESSAEITQEDMELLVKPIDKDGEEVLAPAGENTVVEGVFDGQNMIGSDGRQYIVPPNYASKSKLVEGDILKLTIQPNGTFLYKQIGPIERQRSTGTLTKDEITGDWKALANGKKYALLSAAVSYHKGEAGDEVVILMPKAAPSKWAAVENIVKREI